MGDNYGLQLIPIWMFISISTQNILLSLILCASLVAHSEAYLAASRNSGATIGNWLSLGSTHATNTINNMSHA